MYERKAPRLHPLPTIRSPGELVPSSSHPYILTGILASRQGAWALPRASSKLPFLSQPRGLHL